MEAAEGVQLALQKRVDEAEAAGDTALAAARAVIYCQMVYDPSAVPEEFPTDVDQENERLRLFALISELVQ